MQAVKALCRETAEAVGLHDRGVLKPGFKADRNIIDLDHLRLDSPQVAHDWPTGGRCPFQRA